MRRTPVRSRPLLAATVALCFSACGGKGGFVSPPTLPAAGFQGGQAVREPGHAERKIQHVVIIIQENRSFNNLFYGYPGAKTSKYGLAKKERVKLKPIGLATSWDLEHNPNGFITACNGTGKTPGTHCRMNGFYRENWTCGKPKQPKCPIKYPPYAYVPHGETKPYFDMANQYVLADEMFASNFDSTSFMSHQFIIAGVNPDSTIGIPNGTWGCPGGAGDLISVLGPRRVWPVGYVRACSDQETLGGELDKAGLSWSFYATPLGEANGKTCGHKGVDADGGGSSNGRGIWSAYQTIAPICFSKNWGMHVFTPPNKFLNDIGRPRFELPGVTWITPTYANSDHGGSGSTTGPSWVTSLVNAIGKSQDWDSTAIFIFWDDYGGWYDPEPPAHLDDAGLGMRLPMLIISPYAKKGFVSHVHYEHGSILKFVEDVFGLERLAASDKRANSPAGDCFDFSKAPRKFVPIRAPLDANYFKLQPLDSRPPDSD